MRRESLQIACRHLFPALLAIHQGQCRGREILRRSNAALYNITRLHEDVSPWTAAALWRTLRPKFLEMSVEKLKRSHEEVEAAIRAVPHHSRQTLRSLAAACAIPKTAIVRHLKAVARFKACSSYVKPFLTDDNSRTRMEYAMSFLNPSSSGNHIFPGIYYVYDDEVLALRSAKSKSFITKVMFLAAVARPRYDSGRKQVFDGKIGVWPFVMKAPAARASKNRPIGTILTVPLIVNGDLYEDVVFEKLVPDIKSKFPRSVQGQGIFLQQDNASPHQRVTSKLLESREQFHEAAGPTRTNKTTTRRAELGSGRRARSLITEAHKAHKTDMRAATIVARRAGYLV
ncbi:hypothetical protein H257_04588 [Aphanomyces astaci]|uniref:Uncharacterized protein n=1 Tax=Aphanomyces astaci TaxID=112090 RepID=W4GSX2_APHAT|nr:hypothetical protein H257_04588 [Aphanomyces astaci]ETV82807.1 hypothetical protein H257_04588 [Aphanomyces astaci]|eukprot:XP_009827478.1 hypothetical protein H257_04588 [Aphanomyces astaci]